MRVWGFMPLRHMGSLRLERSSVVGHSWGITCSRAARDDMVSDLDFRLTRLLQIHWHAFYFAPLSNPIIENRFSQFCFSNFRFVVDDRMQKVVALMTT